MLLGNHNGGLARHATCNLSRMCMWCESGGGALWGKLCCGTCHVVYMVCSGVVPTDLHGHMQVCQRVQKYLLKYCMRACY